MNIPTRELPDYVNDLCPDRDTPEPDPDNPNCFIKYKRMYANADSIFPYDDEECDMFDIWCRFLVDLRDGRDIVAPVVPFNGEIRILEIGCGTGVWSSLLAKHQPDWKVVAMDSVPYPRRRRSFVSNLHYNTSEMDGEWDMSSEPVEWQSTREDFDVACLRMLLGRVIDWPGLYRKAYEQLRPGGWIEHIDLDWQLEIEPPRRPGEGLVIEQWSSDLKDALEQVGLSIDISRAEQHLRDAGFVDIRHEVITKYCNPISLDPADSHKGRWFNLALVCKIEGLTLMPFIRILGKSPKETIDMLKLLQKELCTLKIRSYGHFHVWMGRKPENP